MASRYGTTPGTVNYNTNEMVRPLYQLSFKDFWLHHQDNCDQFPPAPGAFLDLPVGGNITLELAMNRAMTSYSYKGAKASAWPDGKNHPDNYSLHNLGGEPISGSGCLSTPNFHTQNESMAAGTVLAISYTSVLSQVTPDNLVVMSVAPNTPWKRLANYAIPKQLPACPPGGCICVWSWVPNGCGQPNIYLEPIRCQVTGATSTIPLSTPKPAVWCEDDKTKCVKGAKQVIIWNQNERNNIVVKGNDISGNRRSPAYNEKLGFFPGAQNDIFGTPSTNTTAPHAKRMLVARRRSLY